MNIPKASAMPLLELCFDAACRHKTEVKALPDKGPETFVEGGGGGVFFSGHSLVVPPEVLDPEVVVV